MRITVVTPTYNEAENLPKLVSALFALPLEISILVVDDNSPDGTGRIADELALKFPDRVEVMHRPGKMGLRSAYLNGFQKLLSSGATDAIVQMDADFSHDPIALVEMVKKLETCDMVLGSRYVKGGKTVNWGWERNVLSKGGALYTRLLTWMPVKDPTAGFVCYRKEVLETINFDEINFVGYAFQIEMKFAAWKLGFKVIEIPITFVDRKFGTSKMNKNIVKEGILGVLKIQWQSMFKNYRRKVRNNTDPVSSRIHAGALN